MKYSFERSTDIGESTKTSICAGTGFLHTCMATWVASRKGCGSLNNKDSNNDD